MNTKVIEEGATIRKAAQRLRGESIDVQLRACDVVCSFIEFELQMHDAERVRQALVKLQDALAKARRHIEEPNHVPLHDVDRLAGMWKILAQRVSILAARTDAENCQK